MHCRYFIIARIACPVSLAQHWNISPSSPCSSAASIMIMTLFNAAGIPLSRNSRVCLIQPFPVAIVLMNVFLQKAFLFSFLLSDYFLRMDSQKCLQSLSFSFLFCLCLLLPPSSLNNKEKIISFSLSPLRLLCVPPYPALPSSQEWKGDRKGTILFYKTLKTWKVFLTGTPCRSAGFPHACPQPSLSSTCRS